MEGADGGIGYEHEHINKRLSVRYYHLCTISICISVSIYLYTITHYLLSTIGLSLSLYISMYNQLENQNRNLN
jgi:hypothetical protein